MGRYVGNTFCYVKISTVNDILFYGLNQKIRFTYELEKNDKLAFLDVLLIRVLIRSRLLFAENQLTVAYICIRNRFNPILGNVVL